MRSLPCLCLLPLVLGFVPVQEKLQAVVSKAAVELPTPTSEQTLAMQTLNGFRAIHGLEPVTLDRRLLAASAQHASSMSKSRQLAHKGSSKQTADAKSRAETFGYDGPVAELVASGVPTAPYAVVSFMDAPYHRRLLLKPGQFEFGCSVDAGFACFVLGGQAQERIVYSPPAGSEGVPTFWDGREEPSPMRGTGLKPPYGYPILVAAYGFEDMLSKATVTLFGPSGTTVDCTVKEPCNDNEAKNSIVIIPMKPLQPMSQYTVSVRFTVGGEERKETWSFRTGDEAPPASKPSSKKK